MVLVQLLLHKRLTHPQGYIPEFSHRGLRRGVDAVVSLETAKERVDKKRMLS